jgi:hypothetical protein
MLKDSPVVALKQKQLSKIAKLSTFAPPAGQFLNQFAEDFIALAGLPY